MILLQTTTIISTAILQMTPLTAQTVLSLGFEHLVEVSGCQPPQSLPASHQVLSLSVLLMKASDLSCAEQAGLPRRWDVKDARVGTNIAGTGALESAGAGISYEVEYEGDSDTEDFAVEVAVDSTAPVVTVNLGSVRFSPSRTIPV